MSMTIQGLPVLRQPIPPRPRCAEGAPGGHDDGTGAAAGPRCGAGGGGSSATRHDAGGAANSAGTRPALRQRQRTPAGTETIGFLMGLISRGVPPPLCLDLIGP